jgi:hypothetical protein
MKHRGFLLITLPAFVFFYSCAGSPDAYARIDAGVYSGSYAKALASIDNTKGKERRTLYPPRNELLLYLDRGMIKHYAGMYGESSRDLEEAERLIEELFARSITQEIASYLVNDNVKDYSGDDYEDLYINVFNSLNYYHADNLEGAMVEIRRMIEKLDHLAGKYERASQKVLDSNDIDTNRLPAEATRFSNSALARYLGVLFFRAAGRPDDARIDYEELLRAYDLAPGVYYNRVPASAAEELSVPAGAGRLNVLAFTGLSPVKAQEVITIPLPLEPPHNFARLAFPKMANRPQAVSRAEAALDSGERFPLELIEDMGAVAAETFKSKHSLIVLKTAARAIIKNTTSKAAAVAATEKGDENVGRLVGLLSKALVEVTEQADTRLSRYFPCYALAGGVNLEPGKHWLTVNYYNGRGGLVHSERREVSVKENALNLEEFVCLK